MNNTPIKAGSFILCVNAKEAVILRNQGYSTIASQNLREILSKILLRNAETAQQEALDAVNRLDYISDADDTDTWDMWSQPKHRNNPLSAVIRSALKAITPFPTPFCDPEDLSYAAPRQFWPCQGTTVLVGRDTIELVRVADSYMAYDCYRPTKLDTLFTPQENRVCLITLDEIRLLKLKDIDVTMVLTYDPEGLFQLVATPHTWNSAIRALCGIRKELGLNLPIGIAPFLVPGRIGEPFFLGLSRDTACERSMTTTEDDEAAMKYSIATNRKLPNVDVKVVVWSGGEDVRALIKFGGFKIYTHNKSTRKVCLSKLPLVSSGAVAGAPIYDFSANYETLHSWTVKRAFINPPAPSFRETDSRRSRTVKDKASPQSLKRRNINTIKTFQGLRRRLRCEANKLRNMSVGKFDNETCGVATVCLNALREGEIYYLNGRAKEKDGEIIIDQKRCKIRCPRWDADKSESLLEWLQASPNVIMLGYQPTGEVFAVVKISNGTEDQQEEAIRRWSEEVGRQFPCSSGATSWYTDSVQSGEWVAIGAIFYTNWEAESLETSQYERYQRKGDYSKPLKMKATGVATPSERARAYVDKVELDEEGDRNRRLSSVMLNVMTKFGKEALEDVKPVLFARSTLTQQEKNRMYTRLSNKETSK